MRSLSEAPSTSVLADVDALGVHVAIRMRDDAQSCAADRARSAWRDAASSSPGAETRTVEISLSARDDLPRALSDLSTRVTLEALDALRGSRLLLHAAGIAAPDGRVLAFVGPSGRGKTTAARHLGTRFGYVSDESVAVDEELTVWPYRKPLSVIVDGTPVKEQIAPSDLGLLPLPSAPLRLVGITLLERDPDADEPRATAVDLIDAICEMTPQISYLPELPSPLQYVARIVDRLGAVTRVIYRDATELPALVDDMFAATPPVRQNWSTPPAAVANGSWHCAAVEDAILVEGRACILRDGVVTALDHRGCLVWTMCLEGATLPEITTAAIAAFGEPDGWDAEALIDQTIDELVRHGLVERA
ncbi:hypothetical protein [Microbacterium sp. SLBN-111]|uniref:hypothetical protein n=1 Tax=Microbacterium sp. SLBN-111 TaxID=3377733 RepID=UPI003C77D3E9